MFDYVQKYKWYESITVNSCWALRSNARWMAEYYTGKRTTINGQRPTWNARHRWYIYVEMLIINKQLSRFLELSMFVCEICIVFGAFFLWVGPC